MRGAQFLLAASVASFAAAAQAGETATYGYDALGRLVATSSNGTANNGMATSLSYDPAGNRTVYGVSGAAGSMPPPGAQPSSASPAPEAEADAAGPCPAPVSAPAAADADTSSEGSAPAAEPCG
jgi:RHS repeat protein